MDIQQILAAAKGQAPGPRGDATAHDASAGGDFAAALAAMSPEGQEGATPATRRQALAALAALAQGGRAEPSGPLPEGLDALTALPEAMQAHLVPETSPSAEGKTSSAGHLPQALLAQLTDSTGQGGDPDGSSVAGPSAELMAVMERLALIQGAGQAPAEAMGQATKLPSSALDLASALLAPGQRPHHPGVETASRGTPDTKGASNPLLVAAANQQEASQGAPRPLPTAEVPPAWASGKAALTPSASPTPRDMANAFMVRREGARPEPVNGAIGQAGIGLPTGSAQASGASGITPAAPQQATLTAPVNSPAWPRQLGQQLIRFGQGGGEQRIEMQLHPAELGPLSVTLKVGEQGAQAQFLSAHAQVRQALEQAIPQLREALAEQGIALGEASVGEQRQGGGESGEARFVEGTGVSTGEDEHQDGDLVAGGDVAGGTILDGRVDLYA
ncbi:flagellar hook-length control protein FliK [Halomonas organivorans]